MTRPLAPTDDTGSELAGLARRIDRIRATVDREAAAVAALDADLDACAADLRRAMAEGPTPAAEPRATGTTLSDAAPRPVPVVAGRGDDDDLFDDVPV